MGSRSEIEENELKKMRGHIVTLALSALYAAVAVAEEPVRINMFRGMWADAPEEQKGPLCNACINLVEQLVPSLIDPDVQQNFVDIFVAVCNLAETMLDPPDYQLAASADTCRRSMGSTSWSSPTRAGTRRKTSAASYWGWTSWGDRLVLR